MTGHYLPVSAIEHWVYCRRQCMLIHADQVWEENVSTVRGSLAHSTVDLGETRSQPGRRLHHSVTVWSDRLGLLGKCDAVEEELATGRLAPIEHKLGSRVGHGAVLQVVAQAVCLEETTGRTVDRGWVFSQGSRRRTTVRVGDPALRRELVTIVTIMRAQFSETTLPPPVHDKRCNDCSLLELCLPDQVHDREAWSRLARTVFDA